MPLFTPADTPADVISKVSASPAEAEAELASVSFANSKLRLAGVYDDRQAGFYMLRTRIPGGRLTWQQADAIARVAAEFSARPPAETEAPEHFLELTTRQCVQLHWIRIADLPEIWRRYDAVGLTSLQACGDSARNITACPVAGIDRDEAFDVTPVMEDVNRYVLDHPEYGSGLPRKFKVALTGCGDDCILAGINDLAFTPAERDRELGFNVLAGGGLSDYPRLASPLDIFIRRDQAIEVTRATIAVFKTLGDFESKAVNRFRGIVDRVGAAQIRAEVASQLSFDPPRAGRSLTHEPRYDHVGVHPQQQAGLSYVGLSVPVGRMLASEFATAADLARRYGDGIRLTPRQDLVITGVPDARLPELLAEPLLETYSPAPPSAVRSVVACTSAPFCKFGIFNVKTKGIELANALRGSAVAGEAASVKIHMSGCKASCAQVQIADIGLRAAVAKDETSYHEAFDVALGGSLQDARLARWVALAVPVPAAFRGVEQLLGAYRDERRTDERFPEFLERLDNTRVRTFFDGGI